MSEPISACRGGCRTAQSTQPLCGKKEDRKCQCKQATNAEKAPADVPVGDDEQAQRHDVVAARGEVKILVNALNEPVRGGDHVSAGDAHQRVVTVELGHHQPLQCIVQRVQSVHEDPEALVVTGLDHESAEQGEDRDEHSTKHCVQHKKKKKKFRRDIQEFVRQGCLPLAVSALGRMLAIMWPW